MKRTASLSLSILIICVLIISFYTGRIFWIKKYGISIEPSEAISVRNVDYFLQNDPKWKNDKIGDTGFSMAQSGCLVACIAASINNFNKSFTPKEINRVFTSNGIYNSHGEILWYKIKHVMEEIDYTYKRYFGAGTIENDLKTGELPIVKVKYLKYGVYHWVLIVGSTEKDFLIMDPLEKSKEVVPLSKHGRVFAYRKLIRK